MNKNYEKWRQLTTETRKHVRDLRNLVGLFGTNPDAWERDFNGTAKKVAQTAKDVKKLTRPDKPKAGLPYTYTTYEPFSVVCVKVTRKYIYFRHLNTIVSEDTQRLPLSWWESYDPVFDGSAAHYRVEDIERIYAEATT